MNKKKSPSVEGDRRNLELDIFLNVGPKLVVFVGCDALQLFKQAGKISQIINSHFPGDLADGFVRGSDQFLGPCDPQVDQILSRGLADVPLELLLQIKGIQIELISKIVQSQLLVVMFHQIKLDFLHCAGDHSWLRGRHGSQSALADQLAQIRCVLQILPLLMGVGAAVLQQGIQNRLHRGVRG